MSVRRITTLTLVAFLAVTATMQAAESRDAAKATAAAGSDLQKLKDAFSAQRDQVLAQREALLKQIKNATGAEREALLEKLRAQVKGRIEEQQALGKQIRDELRKTRQRTPPPGRR